MMKKFLLLFSLFVFAQGVLFAQQTVKGKVTDENNDPVIGVNVLLKGTTVATMTDVDGNYTIKVPDENAVLIFKFIGMKTVEESVESRQTIDVQMLTDATDLGEVVVVGYGAQKKENLTGTVNTVNVDELNEKPTSSLASALQGVAPGVTIISRPGDVGKDIGTINVRGRGNLGTSAPLFIVDGVPVSESYFQRLNANDIASISVLKDAAASAIYGARAAYGVFIVTTKKGKEGKAAISYNGYYGWQSATVLPKRLGSYDFATLKNEAQLNAGRSPIFSDEELAIIKSGNKPDLYPNNDWYSLVYESPAPITEHNVSVQGGGKTRYFVSGTFLEQKSLIPGKELKRYSLRANTERDFGDMFKLGTNVSLIKDDLNRTSGNFSTTDLDRMTPLTVARQSNGEWGSVTAGKESGVLAENNPLRKIAEYGRGSEDTWRLNSSINATLKPIKGLEVVGLLSYNFYYYQKSEFDKTVNPITGFISKAPIQSTAKAPNKLSKEWRNSNNFMAQSYATYSFNHDLHDVSIMAGIQYETYNWEVLEASRKYFPSNELNAINAGSGKAENLGNGGYKREKAFLSQFARLNYAFASKYLFEANIRFDRSSQFHKDNRLGVFPSFSAAWRISEEDFLSNVDWLSNLKLRASWGKLGNVNNVGYYDYFDVLGTGTATIIGESKVDGVWPSKQANNSLSWETVTMSNIGLDMGFLKNKFNVQLDLFKKVTDDILLKMPLPSELGLSEHWRNDERTSVNAGSVENKGIELMLGYNDQIGDLKWGVTANISKIWNKVTDLNGLDDQISGRWIYRVGEAIGSFYTYEADGLFKDQADVDNHVKQSAATKPGDIKYKDVNGDGKLDAEDRTITGNDVPYFTYGVGLNLSYKGLDFSLQGQGVNDVKVYLSGEAALAFFNGAAAKEFHLKRWTKDNPDPNADYPRVLPSSANRHNEKSSSYWLFDADYFRIKNIVLGYTLPKEVTNKIGVERLRVYFAASNLFTIRADKRLKDFDPEMPSARGTYPNLKVISFGLNLSF